MQMLLSIFPIDWINTRNRNRTGSQTGAYLFAAFCVVAFWAGFWPITPLSQGITNLAKILAPIFACLSAMNFIRLIILERKFDQETKKGGWHGLNW